MTVKNQRRIPTTEEFLADKTINDLLYAMLQANSSWTEGEAHRYIEKKKVKQAKWARAIGVSTNTFKARMKALLEDGYVVEEGDYYLLPIVGDRYVLIPQETLQFLLDTATADVIKVYSHLLALKNYYKKDAFFTQRRLLEVIGYNSSYGDNHKKIRNILFLLTKLELIEYKMEHVNGVEIQRITKVSTVVNGLK